MKLDDAELSKVEEKYDKQIVLPQKSSGKQYMLCPVGSIGSGKSSVLKSLSKRLGLVRISADEIRELLKQKGYNWDRVQEMGLHLLEKYLERGYSVGLDSDCRSKSEKIKEIAERQGVKLVWIHINPPEEFIVEKLRNYKHTWLFENGEEAVRAYYDRKEKLSAAPIDFPFIYTFDTSKNDLALQIEEAASKIEKTTK